MKKTEAQKRADKKWRQTRIQQGWQKFQCFVSPHIFNQLRKTLTTLRNHQETCPRCKGTNLVDLYEDYLAIGQAYTGCADTILKCNDCDELLENMKDKQV